METRDDILLAAMTQGRKEITSLIARDTDEWEWGKLHRATLRNSTLGKATSPWSSDSSTGETTGSAAGPPW